LVKGKVVRMPFIDIGIMPSGKVYQSSKPSLPVYYLDNYPTAKTSPFYYTPGAGVTGTGGVAMNNSWIFDDPNIPPDWASLALTRIKKTIPDLIGVSLRAYFDSYAVKVTLKPDKTVALSKGGAILSHVAWLSQGTAVTGGQAQAQITSSFPGFSVDVSPLLIGIGSPTAFALKAFPNPPLSTVDPAVVISKLNGLL